MLILKAEFTISSDSIRDLEHNLTFFYTGLTRKSSSVLNDQKASSEKKSYSFDYFDSIKKIEDKILKIKLSIDKSS